MSYTDLLVLRSFLDASITLLTYLGVLIACALCLDRIAFTFTPSPFLFPLLTLFLAVLGLYIFVLTFRRHLRSVLDRFGPAPAHHPQEQAQ